MNILDYNDTFQSLNNHERLIDDWDYGSSAGRAADVYRKILSAQLEGKKTSLKSGFNEHSIELPNGCCVQVNENGEIYVQEKDGQPKKIRNKDQLQNLLVK